MTNRIKRQSQSLVISFDFTDFLTSEGFPDFDYTSLVDAGLTIFRSQPRGMVVLLTIGEGAQGQSYRLAVRCDTSNGKTLTIVQAIHIARDVVAEAIPISLGFLLVSSAGEQLVNGDSVSLQSAG